MTCEHDLVEGACQLPDSVACSTSLLSAHCTEVFEGALMHLFWPWRSVKSILTTCIAAEIPSLPWHVLSTNAQHFTAHIYTDVHTGNSVPGNMVDKHCELHITPVKSQPWQCTCQGSGHTLSEDSLAAKR